MFGELTNHLWQSTLFTIAVALITLAVRRNRAQVRYWLWFSASCKFFVPFSLLVSLGSHAERASTRGMASPAVAFTMARITQRVPHELQFAPFTKNAGGWILVAITGVWVCGFAAITLVRLRGWLCIRAAVRSSIPIQIAFRELPPDVEIRSAVGLREPGVVGLGIAWSRSILLLPADLASYLTPLQLEAVLAHEFCHVRRRDNLFASIHMIAEAIFWFHPFTWWVGARLVEEREQACDEDVLGMISDPKVYAEAILNVCKLYVNSPLACVSGVTGANVKQRIEMIMTKRIGQNLNRATKLLIAGAGLTAILGPFIFGLINAPLSLAQMQVLSSPKPVIEVASIRPNQTGGRSGMRFAPGSGRAIATNVTLRYLIKWAYNVEDDQISGGPKWLGSAAFDINAKLAHDTNPNGSADQRASFRAMIQPLLADRFKLLLQRTTKELPVYVLVVSKNGSKLKELEKPENPQDMRMSGGSGLMVGRRVPITILTEALRSVVGRLVRDETDLKGYYDFRLQWDPADSIPLPDGNNPNAPISADQGSPSIFTALQEQLGLRLESRKGRVDALVIDRAELPSVN